MIRRLFLIAGWLALGFVVYATLSPIEGRPGIAGPQFERFAAFALLGLAFVQGYPRHTALVLLLVIGSALGLELLQLLTPDRHGRILDALVKATGGILGIGVGRFVPLLWRDRMDRIRGPAESARRPD